MRHAILAKRSSRMAVITCSSHPNHPKYWQRLLKAMFSKLQQASTVTKKAFAQLSSADQRAVLGTSKMSEYVCGLERLAEATLWVAATCSEAMLYEAESASAWKLAQDVLKMLATTYQQEPSKVRSKKFLHLLLLLLLLTRLSCVVLHLHVVWRGVSLVFGYLA